MSPPPADSAVQDGERNAYRAGFGDGYVAAVRMAREAPERQQAGAATSGGDKGAGKDDKNREAGDDKSDKGKGQDKGEDEHNDKKSSEPSTPLYKRPLVVLLVIVVVLAALVAAVLFWRHSRQHASTDDAFIDGQASRIAAQARGRVARLYVRDNQMVKAGDALLDIDTADLDVGLEQAQAQLQTARSQVEQAQAQVAGAQANVAQAQAASRQAEAEATQKERDLERVRAVDPDAIAGRQADSAWAEARVARAKVDAARSNTRAAVAQVKAAQARVAIATADVATARANVASAELQRGYTHVVAPIAGRVTRRSVDIGNVIAVGQALLAIVSDDLWVTANYKETQLAQMRVGQPVDVTVDAFPDIRFAAHVDSIQRGTGSFFSMLPAENATGNYVKVVQRVPVKIVFDRPQDLSNYAIGPGMSVVPDVQLGN